MFKEKYDKNTQLKGVGIQSVVVVSYKKHYLVTRLDVKYM